MPQSNLTRENILAYYRAPGPMTQVSEATALLEGLPDDLLSLVQAVQNMLIHVFWADRYGRKLSEAEQATLNVRAAQRKLALLTQTDPRPLTQPRSLMEKQVGNCRDFSVLLCALLRYKGIPARARAGFGTYFLPGHYEDHWVCEYWNDSRQDWVMVDAQLDDFQCKELGVTFDPLDVPRNLDSGPAFITGGKAWQLYRKGADPDKFGIFDMHGVFFIQGDLVRDLMALNKFEILPWDGGWGWLTEEKQEKPEFYADFDQFAALTLGGEAAFTELRKVYDEQFQPPELE